ncbi:DUF1924 domain-containing protein [Hydrogenimonas thermophila]|uniref:Cytochrome c domain-containing protein n=1 Tax=Hydrogenimonas thermophila TaxID=223786 RepID=A0A1I5UEY8_9BACT|nr:DUF1924 domain-containing protein [Hydrogenimonas thermophila]WOE69185.1 DUF1924 domain-containing protein [Hydrogenimonas thermophila]WOE71695.1 DUF1924 domain-containing protein [Hydrogenimonas thermophila]SFP93597.1 protein of unknown function [Hydrogenimonas thermophila]
MKRYILLLGSAFTFVIAAPIDDYMQSLKVQAKIENPSFKGFDAKRGEDIFFSQHIGKRGKKISCASCHTNDLTKNGENIFTGKKLEPLSPKVNSKRLKDVKKVKKWLRRNFKDVYKREGTAIEKGDVLTFILSK